MSDGMRKEKAERFARLMAEARDLGLEVREVDSTKPWGGYIRFRRASLGSFLAAYWRGIQVRDADLDLDAKLLLVAPRHRLSLQSHARRSELWRVLEGPAVVSMGPSENELDQRLVRPGKVVTLPCGWVHRVSAPDNGWAILAEFWQHEDPAAPSDENDIIRYEDDYGRAVNGDGAGSST